MRQGDDPVGEPPGELSPGGLPTSAESAETLRRRDAELQDADLAERLEVDPDSGDVKG